jgi:hypothetical protein
VIELEALRGEFRCYAVTWVRLRAVENEGSDEATWGSGAPESRCFSSGLN